MKSSLTVILVLAVLVGVVVGVGAYTFIYAKGYSYLSNDPSACTNCHVMQAQFDGWIKSSHRNAATCNDCHTPHNFIGKYAVKASNGFFHSLFFTTGKYPDNIQITNRNHRVAEAACRHCHENIVQAVDTAHGNAKGIECIRCHGAVGHSAAESTSVKFPTLPRSNHETER